MNGLIYDSTDGEMIEESKEEFKASHLVRRAVRPVANNESRNFLDTMVTN